MKKFCFIIPILLLVSCSGYTSNKKISERIKKCISSTFAYKSVNVNFDTDIENYSRLIVDIENSKSMNLDETAEEIIFNLEEKVPEISQNDEIIIRFKQGDTFEEFSFEGNSTLSLLDKDEAKTSGF